MKMGEAPDLYVEAIPTGSIGLDLALGIGGVPRGRIVEIYGTESSGKTTLCLHIIAEAQKMGGICAFIDVEHALDPSYAAKIGVDIKNLYVSLPETAEDALEIVEILVRSSALDVIVIDSVAALVPRAEVEGQMGDSHMGVQARLMSQALRKLAGAVKISNTSLIFTNQIRHKIGVVYANQEATPGGKALKLYATVRLEIRSGQTIKYYQQEIGKRSKIKVVKNKLASPFRRAQFDIIFAEGISKTGDLLDTATNLKIIHKKGPFYYYLNRRLGRGREAAKQYLKQNARLFHEIDTHIRQSRGLPPRF